MINNKNIYFFCTITSDLLIASSIAKIIRELYNNSNITLIISSNRRISENYKIYTNQFDKIIKLESCYFGSNPFTTVTESIKFNNQLKKIDFKKDSYIFIFDVYELTQIIFYQYIAKIKSKLNIKLSIISAFHNDIYHGIELTIDIKKTLIKSVPIILLFQKCLFVLKFKNSNLSGIHKFKIVCDLQICIESSSYTSIPQKIIKNIIYPPIIFSNENSNYSKLEKSNSSIGVIYFLIEYLYSNTKNYWVITNNILSMLIKSGYDVYIKDHPNSMESIVDKIKVNEVKILPNNLTVEEFLLSEFSKVKAVVGHGSTALITASWLGLNAIDVTEVYNFSNQMVLRNKNFLKLGNKIIHVNTIKELENIQFDKNSQKVILKENLIKQVNYIFSILKTI